MRDMKLKTGDKVKFTKRVVWVSGSCKFLINKGDKGVVAGIEDILYVVDTGLLRVRVFEDEIEGDVNE